MALDPTHGKSNEFRCPNCGAYRSEPSGSYDAGQVVLWLVALALALTVIGLVISIPIWSSLNSQMAKRRDRTCRVCGFGWRA